MPFLPEDSNFSTPCILTTPWQSPELVPDPFWLLGGGWICSRQTTPLSKDEDSPGLPARSGYWTLTETTRTCTSSLPLPSSELMSEMSLEISDSHLEKLQSWHVAIRELLELLESLEEEKD